MSYIGNAFRALTFRKGAVEKLRKQPAEGLVAFLGLSALLTVFYLPVIALIINLRSLLGGGGPLVYALPTNLALLLIILFIIFFVITAGIGLLFVYVLHLFSSVFGAQSRFRELLSAWTPALIPLNVMILPLFVVMVYGFLGGPLSDAVGTAIGVLFNVLLVAMSLFVLVYTFLTLKHIGKFGWSAALAVFLLSALLTGMVKLGVLVTFAWLI